MKEVILCSAIHLDDGNAYKHQPKNITSGLVVCGYRHHNCFTLIHALNVSRAGKEVTQGFLTNKDRFVDRYEAYEIHYGKPDKPKRLFSENLY